MTVQRLTSRYTSITRKSQNVNDTLSQQQVDAPTAIPTFSLKQGWEPILQGFEVSRFSHSAHLASPRSQGKRGAGRESSRYMCKTGKLQNPACLVLVIDKQKDILYTSL